jgi:hemerythrin-like domain-containing protein
MKRSEALAPLSRDHQHALDAALRLRRASADTVEDAIAHFQRFFDAEGRGHFAIEEEHLLHALPADDPEWALAADRVRDDHAAIRGQAAELAAATSIPTSDAGSRLTAAQELGQRLNDHVRFEERVLFELLEQRLAPGELARVGEAVARAEDDRSRGRR